MAFLVTGGFVPEETYLPLLKRKPLLAHAGNISRVAAEQVIALMGAQWGDEGKGKLVDVLGANFDIIARCAGGSNAGNAVVSRYSCHGAHYPAPLSFSLMHIYVVVPPGHTVIVDGKKHAFHLLPSGILHERPVCLIGNGTVVHVPTLLKELNSLEEKAINYKGRVKLSDRSHIVFDFHQQIDAFLEDNAKKVTYPFPRGASVKEITELRIVVRRVTKTGRLGPRARGSGQPTVPRSRG